jgi:hypothetical protein
LRFHPAERLASDIVARADHLSEEWFERLARDPEAWRVLL